MEQVIKKLNIDLDRRQVAGELTVPVKQGDDQSREIIITLRSSGVAWDVPQSAALRLRLLKPDNTAVYDDLPKSTDGKVHITLGGQMLTATGTARADIEITDGGAMLSSFLFYLDISDQAIPDGTVESSSEFGALQSLISSAESAIESCESAAEGVTEAKEEAHTNALAAATAASLANQKAQDAEEAASNAQTQANAAQSGATAANSAASAANTAADRANRAVETLEGLDVSQLVPEFLKVWDCPDGDAKLELWAAASGGMVEYYAVLNGTFSQDTYSNDTLSGVGNGEMVNLFEADPKFLPELSETDDGVQSVTFNGIIGVKDSKTARINLVLISSEGTALQTVSADLTGYTLLNLGSVISLGRVKSQAHGEAIEEKESRLFNLIDDRAMLSGKANGAAFEKGEDGKITVTSNTEYGRYDVTCTRKGKPFPQRVFVICKFRASESGISSFVVRPVVYAYRGSENLGELSYYMDSVKRYVSEPGEYIVKGFLSLKENQIDCDRLDVGIMSLSPGSVIEFYSYVMLDGDNFQELFDYVDWSAMLDEKGWYKSTDNLFAHMSEWSKSSETAQRADMPNNWVGKNVLFIGDSITEYRKYPEKIKELLGINVFYHCKGGIGLAAMVDGTPDGSLKPLSIEEVSGKDLIVLLGGYNNRGLEDGEVGDCYNPDGGGQATIAGYMQYCINRIYDTLESAQNKTCRLLIVTVDCAGRYPYIDADGYDEYPAGSGRTMESMADIQKAVAAHNSIPCVDLWHSSGINGRTWDVFGASPNAVNEQYSIYELNAEGDPVNETRMKYVKGESYYQIRDGKVVLEEYTGDAPYPYNGDQLHKSELGYNRIGECIAGAMMRSYMP